MIHEYLMLSYKGILIHLKTYCVYGITAVDSTIMYTTPEKLTKRFLNSGRRDTGVELTFMVCCCRVNVVKRRSQQYSRLITTVISAR